MTRWLVDDRPPTPYTRLYRRAMWLARDKEAFEGEQHTLKVARKAQQSGDAPPTLLTRTTTRISSSDVQGMRVWAARPRRRRPRARVLYVHGGGYVHPLTGDYWRLVRSLVGAPAEVLVPAYQLAPDATADDVVPRLVELVRTTCADGVPTVLMGDSAGGALVLVVAQTLRDRGGPSPAGVVALSPWLDATLSETEVPRLEASDPMLAESGLRAAGRWWSGDRDPDDPVVSPVNGELAGLPPLDVFIGAHDILRPAVDTLAERAHDAEVQLTVREVPAMFHVWMTRAIPEARRTRKQLVELVRLRAQQDPL